MKIRIYIAIAAAVVTMLPVGLHAGARDDIEPARLKEMKEKILTSSRDIAAQYGNPAFSIIITSEDERAIAVKKRFGEMQKIDASENILNDLKAQIKVAQAEATAKEAYLASIDMKIKGAQLELAAAEKKVVGSQADMSFVPPADQPTAPQPAMPAPGQPTTPTVVPKDTPTAANDSASAAEVLKNLGMDSK